MAEAELPMSPRLAALRTTITSGDEAALSVFWQAIEAEGTPLIESWRDRTKRRL
ncbi:MAG TPA: hypothetical protein VKQ36_05445 [Ktedonobacterales bacterium]|nr:hypothetical protein [Ktedonobacterales bacterium]